MSKQFYFKQFSLAYVNSLVIVKSLIGPYQVLPFWVRVDLGEMAIKGFSSFSKAPALMESPHQIAKCHIQDTRWRNLASLQRSSQCILQPQPTGPEMNNERNNDVVCWFQKRLLELTHLLPRSFPLVRAPLKFLVLFGWNLWHLIFKKISSMSSNFYNKC